MSPVIHIKCTPGDSENCPRANAVGAPEGVCGNCEYLEKCKKTARKHVVDTRVIRNEIFERDRLLAVLTASHGD
jgi:hypothetical protein